jgi:hypothetical protein
MEGSTKATVNGPTTVGVSSGTQAADRRVSLAIVEDSRRQLPAKPTMGKTTLRSETNPPTLVREDIKVLIKASLFNRTDNSMIGRGRCANYTHTDRAALLLELIDK